jgi:signal peptidase II
MLNKQVNPLQWLWLTLLIVILDQITKNWISQTLTLYESVAIFSFFNFTLVHNTGAAFSFLAEAGGWQRWLLTGLALIVSVIIVVWLSRLKTVEHRWLAIALALVLGGAIGNLIDRIIYGYVIDFLDLYYKMWHWPAFNVADSAISIGAVMLLIDAIRGEKHG